MSETGLVAVEALEARWPVASPGERVDMHARARALREAARMMPGLRLDGVKYGWAVLWMEKKELLERPVGKPGNPGDRDEDGKFLANSESDTELDCSVFPSLNAKSQAAKAHRHWSWEEFEALRTDSIARAEAGEDVPIPSRAMLRSHEKIIKAFTGEPRYYTEARVIEAIAEWMQSGGQVLHMVEVCDAVRKHPTGKVLEATTLEGIKAKIDEEIKKEAKGNA